jgi:membrane protein
MGTFAHEVLARGKEIARGFTENRLALTAGGIAFFTALALAPTFFAFGAIASLFVDRADLERLLRQVLDQTPRDIDPDNAVIPQLVDIAAQGSTGALTSSSIIAVIVAVYSASKVVMGLRMALDSIFGVSHEQTGLIARAMAGLVAFIGLVVFALAAATLAVLPRIAHVMGLSDSQPTSTIVMWIAGLVLLYGALRAFYRHGPHLGRGRVVNVPWVSWQVGFAALWVVGVTGFFGLYVNFSGALGAAIALFGASVVFLVWLYFVVMGILIGAQFLATSSEIAIGADQRSEQ